MLHRLLPLTHLITFAQLRPAMRVGNFFAGRGHVALRAAREVGPGGRVFAIDHDQTWFPQIQSAARDAGLNHLYTVHAPDLLADGALSEIPAHSLDVLIMINNHVTASTSARLLSLAHQLLRPTGTLVLGDTDGRNAALGEACERGFVLIDECCPSRYHYALRMRS